MRVHLVDGTYELFRHYYGAPSHVNASAEEVGATRAALGSLLGLIEDGATHVGVATDHVIESWRNNAWPAYKSSAGVPEDLLGQFCLFEASLRAMGLVVWPMVDLEADDALASAAAVLSHDSRAEEIFICTPDKDLAQCVREKKVVCLDRREGAIMDEEAVRSRFGLAPESVPDWLALVGDSADGYPGIRGWGPKAATAVLARYEHVEAIPDDAGAWDTTLPPGRAASLAAALADGREEVALFKQLATCTIRPEILPAGPEALDALEWRGPERGQFSRMCGRLEASELAIRAARLLARRRGTPGIGTTRAPSGQRDRGN